EINVVILSHAIELDAGVTADRSVDFAAGHAAGADRAGGAGREGCKLVHAATRDRDLRNLLTGDDVALFTGIALHADGVGLDGDGFLSAAELHLEVDTSAVPDLEDEAFLFGHFESGGFGFGVVVADFEFGHDVLAGVVGGGAMNETGLEIDDGDLYVGHGSTGGIGDCADDGGVLCHHGR